MKKPKVKAKKPAAKLPMSLPKKKATKKAAAAGRQGDNAINAADKESFLRHKDTIYKAQKAAKSAHGKYRKSLAEAKVDGFSKRMFDAAFAMETPEGEEVIRLQTVETLKAARYVGADMGSQLELFLEPTRVPAVDRAFGEGETASMKNQPRKPPYDSSVPQYAAWMDGYNKHQEKLAKGIKAKTKGGNGRPAKGEGSGPEAASDGASEAQDTPPASDAPSLADQPAAGQA